MTNPYNKPLKDLEERENKHSIMFIIYIVLFAIFIVTDKTTLAVMFGVLLIITKNNINYLRLREHQKVQFDIFMFEFNEIKRVKK